MRNSTGPGNVLLPGRVLCVRGTVTTPPPGWLQVISGSPGTVLHLMQQSKEWNVRKSNDLFVLRNWDSMERGAPYLPLSLSLHWGNRLSASTCGQASGAERIGNHFSFLIPLSFSLSQVSLSPSLKNRNVLPLLELQLVARPLGGVAGFLWGVCALVEDTRAHEDYFI